MRTTEADGISMSRKTAEQYISIRRSVLMPTVNKVVDVALETGMSPCELEAVLILAWHRAIAKGILTKRSWP